MGDKRKTVSLILGDGTKVEVEDTTMNPDYVAYLNKRRSGKEIKKVDVRRKVPDIENGTVIDHIVVEYVKEVYLFLRENWFSANKITLSLLENVESKKMGKKGMIKLYDYELGDKGVESVYSLFEHENNKPTISYIKDWVVYKKLKPI